MKVKVLVTQSCPILCHPIDCSPQAPLSMIFYSEEYWRGLPYRSPGYLSDPGLEPVSLKFPALARFVTI